jgi:hypothetical protein
MICWRRKPLKTIEESRAGSSIEKLRSVSESTKCKKASLSLKRRLINVRGIPLDLDVISREPDIFGPLSACPK